MSITRQLPFRVTRHGEPILSQLPSQIVQTGVHYNALIPGLVPEVEERDKIELPEGRPEGDAARRREALEAPASADEIGRRSDRTCFPRVQMLVTVFAKLVSVLGNPRYEIGVLFRSVSEDEESRFHVGSVK